MLRQKHRQCPLNPNPNPNPNLNPNPNPSPHPNPSPSSTLTLTLTLTRARRCGARCCSSSPRSTSPPRPRRRASRCSRRTRRRAPRLRPRPPTNERTRTVLSRNVSPHREKVYTLERSHACSILHSMACRSAFSDLIIYFRLEPSTLSSVASTQVT